MLDVGKAPGAQSPDGRVSWVGFFRWKHRRVGYSLSLSSFLLLQTWSGREDRGGLGWRMGCVDEQRGASNLSLCRPRLSCVMDGGVTRSGVSLFARWHLRLRVVLPDAESDPGGFTRRSPLYLYYKGWWPEQGLIRGGGASHHRRKNPSYYSYSLNEVTKSMFRCDWILEFYNVTFWKAKK